MIDQHRATITVSEEEAQFNGIDNIDDFIKEFDSKYLRSRSHSNSGNSDNALYESTIAKFLWRYLQHYKNRHLVIKCRLPIKYLSIDVGDYVLFDKLVDGVKAHGIDYTRVSEVNSQWRYPLFLCTYMKKAGDYVDIECLQLHHLHIGIPAYYWAGWNDIGDVTMPEIYKAYIEDIVVNDSDTEVSIMGCTDPTASNYNPDATLDDGTCQYPPPPVYGCTSSDATNYNPDATVDDGTCVFPDYDASIDSGQSLSFGFINFDNFPQEQFDTQAPFILAAGGNRFIAIQNDPLFWAGFGYDEQFSINDDMSGFGQLFNINTFKAKYSSDEGFQSISSWNDLLPGHFTTHNPNTENYVVMVITHTLTGEGTGVSSGQEITGKWSYTLKNTQTIEGEPIQLEWVLEDISPDESYVYKDSIVATIYNQESSMEMGGSTFKIENFSDYGISYIEPCPTTDPILEDIEGFAPSVMIGDLVPDGTIDILDVVALINGILEDTWQDENYDVVADMNFDGFVNILDVVTIVNQILGNNE